MSATSHFAQELERTPEAAEELSEATQWRYMNGMFPKGIDWLKRHPNLLRALAADAEAHRQDLVEATS